jgi:hypothetical protein
VRPLWKSSLGVLLRYPHLEGAALKIIGSYNDYLGILSDEGKRKHLETLTEGDAAKDDIYQEARHLTHTFRDGLLAFFFDAKSEMDILSKTYGVF